MSRQLTELKVHFLLSSKANEKTLLRQINDQLQMKRQFPSAAMHHKIGQACESTWTLRAKETQE